MADLHALLLTTREAWLLKSAILTKLTVDGRVENSWTKDLHDVLVRVRPMSEEYEPPEIKRRSA